ncbi:MAG: CrcB family protein [Bdellovibrionales bacterium]|nr:CrcB family protein [Bdellovibrionales bacterium]
MCTQIAFVGLGGLLGSIARYLVFISITGLSLFGSHGLVTANATGSFLAGLSLPWIINNDSWRLFFGVGFLGSFTTMSAFSISAVEMLKLSKTPIALSTIFLHLVLCISVCALGLIVGTRFKV